jgi:gas vesicle protein
MAQHATKGLKAKAATGGRKTSGKTKKGARYVAPKSNDRIQQVARQKVSNGDSFFSYTSWQSTATVKKLSSNINNSIERQMVQAASAGKLTIMKNSGPEEKSKDGWVKPLFETCCVKLVWWQRWTLASWLDFVEIGKSRAEQLPKALPNKRQVPLW